MIKKILFYTSTPRNFRTTMIYYLQEIASRYPVILLSEEVDEETKAALENKKNFPMLEKIISINQYANSTGTIFKKNQSLCNAAKNAVTQYKPDVVILSSDINSLFELYLARFSKKFGAVNIALQTTNEAESTVKRKWLDMTNSYLKFPTFLPLKIRLLLVKYRKYYGHFFYYYTLPLLAGERPFIGKSSYILLKGKSGMRDADYQIVFSKKEYDIYIKEGVSQEKLFILSHPLARNNKFLDKIFIKKTVKHRVNKKKTVLIILTDEEIGFRRKDNSLISNKEREREWVGTIKLIVQILSGWKIYIKPHPDSKYIKKIKEKMEFISKNIEFLNLKEPADRRIEIADIIIALPLSVSTVLFTASLQCSEKPIISLDFDKEILGDFYKDFEGIEYINTEKKLIDILKKIKDKKYRKKTHIKPKKESNEFSSTIEMIEYMFKKFSIQKINKIEENESFSQAKKD